MLGPARWTNRPREPGRILRPLRRCRRVGGAGRKCTRQPRVPCARPPGQGEWGAVGRESVLPVGGKAVLWPMGPPRAPRSQKCPALPGQSGARLRPHTSWAPAAAISALGGARGLSEGRGKDARSPRTLAEDRKLGAADGRGLRETVRGGWKGSLDSRVEGWGHLIRIPCPENTRAAPRAPPRGRACVPMPDPALGLLLTGDTWHPRITQRQGHLQGHQSAPSNGKGVWSAW